MRTIDMIRLMKRIDKLISMRSTGRPDTFAARLSVAPRTLYNYLKMMREFGAPITYSRNIESYIYKEEGRFIVKFDKNEFHHYAT
ncbi:MAG TPA: hypothetical protein VJ951_07115 [Bacteroidales bacterium]|nr:hypothetical protein [Bacteroidales bacterium]